MHINLQMISYQALCYWKNFRPTFNNVWQRVFTKGCLFFYFLDYWSNSFLWPLLSFAAAGVMQCFRPPWGRGALRDSNPTNCSLLSYLFLTSFQFQLVIPQSALLLLRWRIRSRIDPTAPHCISLFSIKGTLHLKGLKLYFTPKTPPFRIHSFRGSSSIWLPRRNRLQKRCKMVEKWLVEFLERTSKTGFQDHRRLSFGIRFSWNANR